MLLNLYDEIINYVPEFMREDDDFKKIIRLYCDAMEENFDYSHDTIQVKLIDKLQQKYRETNEKRYSDFRSDILRSALNELFKTAEDASKSTELYDKLKEVYTRLGLSIKNLDMINSLDKILSEQNIIVNKSFNTNKGKYAGYAYIFDLIDQSQINGESSDGGGFIEILEGTEDNPKQPFTYRVNTSIYKETYENLVKPMVHPIGFGYSISTILLLMFEDYFGIELKQTLNYAVIKCLQPNGAYIETDLMVEYDVVDFNENEKSDGSKRFVLNVKDKKTGENLKFILDYDSSVTLYSMENLTINNAELSIPTDGVFTPVYNDLGELVSIIYNQYFINRKKSVKIRYSINGDTRDNVYVANIPIDIDSLPKVPGENFVEPITITPDDLMNYTADEIKGTVVTEYPRSCGLEYDIKTEYITTLKDEISFKKIFNTEDWFPRKNHYALDIVEVDRGYSPFSYPKVWIPYVGNFYIGGFTKTDKNAIIFNVGYAYDAKRTPPQWDPLVGELDIDYGRDIDEQIIEDRDRYVGMGKLSDNYTNEEVEKIKKHELFPDKGWVSLIDKFIIGKVQDDGYRISKFLIYNPDYKDQDLPKFEILGKNEQYWINEQPIYNIVHDESYISPEPYRFQSYENEYQAAWDVVLFNKSFIVTKKINNKGWQLSSKKRYVGEGTVGDNYNDDEIEQILAHKLFPNKGNIGYVDYFLYGKEETDAEWFLKERILTVGDFDIGSKYSEEEIEKIKKLILYPEKGDIIEVGKRFTPYWHTDTDAEYWDYYIDEEFYIGYKPPTPVYFDFEDIYDNIDEDLKSKEIFKASYIWKDTKKPGTEWFLHKRDFIVGDDVILDSKYAVDEIPEIMKGKLYPYKGEFTLIDGTYYAEYLDEKEWVLIEKWPIIGTFSIGDNSDDEEIDNKTPFMKKAIKNTNEKNDDIKQDMGYTDEEIRLIKDHILYPDKGEIKEIGNFLSPKWHLDADADYWDYYANEEFEIIVKHDDLGWTYTNGEPMPEKVFGYPRGLTFFKRTMRQMWDGLLYGLYNIFKKDKNNE